MLLEYRLGGIMKLEVPGGEYFQSIILNVKSWR
jgi:hypothetical protein